MSHAYVICICIMESTVTGGGCMIMQREDPVTVAENGCYMRMYDERNGLV